MKQLFFGIFIFAMCISCQQEDNTEKAINDIGTDISIERFDMDFADATEKTLPKLKKAYPFMFPKTYSDSVWISKINDTLQQELFREVKKIYPKTDKLQSEIESLFNHIKYYFPDFHPPRVITTTSFVDYRNKVIVTDTIALVALDNFLGKDHYFYKGIPVYIAANLRPSQIVVDLANAYAEKYAFQKQRKTLLDEMVYYGKLLYFKDKAIPFKSEAERIGYTEEELQWAKTNESDIWRYFVERELLYSTDSKLPGRFIVDAPFSKFYLQDIDTNSPGRIGQYIGWQIVRAYMENNDKPFNEMLTEDAETIFNNSKFKPKK
ncbi:gliding motility lipoprotein GldB [Gaetbulibacter aestuarii]|uniref:Gliding motility lipoprotein GldB n=1 Tax=Gaetbulibacter aestuarii TaxID=1502358 RepID=A0ABW7N032_9FLAO